MMVWSLAFILQTCFPHFYTFYLLTEPQNGKTGLNFINLSSNNALRSVLPTINRKIECMFRADVLARGWHDISTQNPNDCFGFKAYEVQKRE